MRLFDRINLPLPRFSAESTASKVYDKLLEFAPYLKESLCGVFKEEFILLLSAIIETNLDCKRYQKLSDPDKNKVRELFAKGILNRLVVNLLFLNNLYAPIINLEG